MSKKQTLIRGTAVLTATSLTTRFMGFFYRMFLSHSPYRHQSDYPLYGIFLPHVPESYLRRRKCRAVSARLSGLCARHLSVLCRNGTGPVQMCRQGSCRRPATESTGTIKNKPAHFFCCFLHDHHIHPMECRYDFTDFSS